MKKRNRVMAVIVSLLVILSMMPAASAASLGVQAPGKVTGVTATSKSDSITLKWNTVKNAKGYSIAYRKASSKTYSYIKVGEGVRSKTIKNLKSSTKYYVKLRAYVYNGFDSVYGPYSNSMAVVTAKSIPGTPVISSVKPGKAKATVYWKKVTGVNGYVVAYKRASSSTWHTKTVSSDKLSKTIYKLTRHKKYQFKVRAYKYELKNGKKIKRYGKYSSIKSATIK